MTSKSKNSLTLPAKKPIQSIIPVSLPSIAVQEDFFHESSDIGYFLLTTIDHKLMLVSIDNQKEDKFGYHVVELGAVGTHIFFLADEIEVFVGCHNGDILKCAIYAGTGKNMKYELRILPEKFMEPKPHPESAIFLLYTRGETIFSWNIETCIKLINKNTMILQSQFTINQEINCGISFANPYNRNSITACVGFSNDMPPFIFDCDDEKGFTWCLETGVSVYKQEELTESEVTLMSQNTHQGSEDLYIVCSSTQCIIIYTLQCLTQKSPAINYLEPLYKFETKYELEYLSVAHGMLMASMYKGILFIDIAHRCKQLMIEKENLDASIGFVLKRYKDKIKFVLNQGFVFGEGREEEFRKEGSKIDRVNRLRVREKDVSKMIPKK